MSGAAESFSEAIKDAQELLCRFDEEQKTKTSHNSEALKRAALVMALAAWETYVKDRFREEFETWLAPVKGSAIGKFVAKRRDEDIKRFFNPNSERTARLFMDYFETDLTRGWEWDNYKSPEAKKILDGLIAKRGNAAHKANTSRKPNADPHLVKREELEKAIRFLKGLVAASEKVKIAK
jgi:RiboL-PSP-HEPN